MLFKQQESIAKKLIADAKIQEGTYCKYYTFPIINNAVITSKLLSYAKLCSLVWNLALHKYKQDMKMKVSQYLELPPPPPYRSVLMECLKDFQFAAPKVNLRTISKDPLDKIVASLFPKVKRAYADRMERLLPDICKRPYSVVTFVTGLRFNSSKNTIAVKGLGEVRLNCNNPEPLEGHIVKVIFYLENKQWYVLVCLKKIVTCSLAALKNMQSQANQEYKKYQRYLEHDKTFTIDQPKF